MADTTQKNYLVRIGFDDLGRAEAQVVGFGNTVQRSFNKADVATGKTTLAMRGLSTAIKAIPFVLGFEAARRFVTGLFNANAESQRLHASLKTVTGSTEAAMAAFDMIREFAKTTPYELTEVVEAFIRLKSVGLDAGMESLRSYGNTAAATGRSLMQFIEAVADAATGEFERLRDFGITASSQGDKVAFTFRGVTTEVRKNAAEVTEYLLGIGNTDYASGMAEQADTLYGKLSNLADTVFGFWEELGNSSGAASALESIIGLVDKFGKYMTDLVRKSRDFWDEWQGRVERCSGHQPERGIVGTGLRHRRYFGVAEGIEGRRLFGFQQNGHGAETATPGVGNPESEGFRGNFGSTDDRSFRHHKGSRRR